MQATSAASLETALNACREEYTEHMEGAVRGAACVSRNLLPRHHATALNAARTAFFTRRTLAAPAIVNARLDTLLHVSVTYIESKAHAPVCQKAGYSLKVIVLL